VVGGRARANGAGRDDPREEGEGTIGVPEIRGATEVEIETARRIKEAQQDGLKA